MGEAAAPRKKLMGKKQPERLVDRKGLTIGIEHDDRPSRWREEKKSAPVRMKK